MQQMCCCCGQQPAISAEFAAQVEQARSRALPPTLRKQIPLDRLARIEQGRRNAPLPRVGFCIQCSRADCDGVTPCRVPPQEWAAIAQITQQTAAWDYARTLEAQWRRGELGPPPIAVETGAAPHWYAVTESYWRKEIPTGTGVVIAEVVQPPAAAGFRAWVRRGTPQRPDPWDSMISHDAVLPLHAAQMAAEGLVQDLLETNFDTELIAEDWPISRTADSTDDSPPR